jgi:hypothetical protein
MALPEDDRDPSLLRHIYEFKVLTRAVEDRMVAMDKGGDLLGSLYPGHWHEAISVGAASALHSDGYPDPQPERGDLLRARPRAEDRHAGHAAGRAALLISSIRDNSPTTTTRSTGSPRPGSSPPFETHQERD